MKKLRTIGVYGFDRDSFIHALGNAEVDLLLDVRQRRGVRGSEYAWANAQRLQDALAEAGIGYSHLKELAPTTEMRQLQYEADARLGEGKRNRTTLAPAYVERDPEACHRSLIAERLRRDLGFEVEHLRPA